MLLGLTTDDWPDRFPEFAAAAGKMPAFIQVFWSLDSNKTAYDYSLFFDLYDSLGVTPFVELTTDNLPALIAGERDAAIQELITAFSDWSAAGSGRYMLVAPLPEANLDEHPWAGDPAAYQLGYDAIRDAFLDAGLDGDVVRWVFSMNGLSTDGLSYAQFYPGDDKVDVLGFSKLNRGGPSYRDYEETFGQHIDEMQAEIGYEKPIIVTQTASVDDAYVDRATWLIDMFSGLKSEPQVIGAAYFSKDRDFDFRILVDSTLDQAFKDGYQTWSEPSAVSWMFDGLMDAWVVERASTVVFDDIAGNPFADDIVWLAEQGVTLGCGPFEYCPQELVSRAQMATFLVRALGLPSSDADWFVDDDGTTHEASIDSVADAGISLGCGGNNYCPADWVSRAQMASFLSRAYNLTPSNVDVFTDDNGTTHEGNINALASSGITQGCGGSSYCPSSFVNRGQMAAFLHRADALP
jgi:hypothetical protein